MKSQHYNAEEAAREMTDLMVRFGKSEVAKKKSFHRHEEEALESKAARLFDQALEGKLVPVPVVKGNRVEQLKLELDSIRDVLKRARDLEIKRASHTLTESRLWLDKEHSRLVAKWNRYQERCQDVTLAKGEAIPLITKDHVRSGLYPITGSHPKSMVDVIVEALKEVAFTRVWFSAGEHGRRLVAPSASGRTQEWLHLDAEFEDAPSRLPQSKRGFSKKLIRQEKARVERQEVAVPASAPVPTPVVRKVVPVAQAVSLISSASRRSW